MAITTVTLDEIHDAIVNTIKTKFPAFKTVEAYRLDRKNLPTPACLIELVEMPIDDIDMGTEQASVNARFEATLVIDFRQKCKNEKLEIRKLAAVVMNFIRLQRWGVSVGPAELIGAFPDDFTPELDQYECWRIEWNQVLHLGESIWNDYDEGETPAHVLTSFVPDIGAAHEDDYVELT